MTAFKFRLESLLKLREAEREECRLRLAEAFQAEALLQDQAEEFARQLREMAARARVGSSPGTVDVDEMINAQRYRATLEVQMKVLEQKREQLAGEIDKRREALVEADRNVRTLEKLKERKLEEHRAAELQRERKQLDELTAQQFKRRKEAQT